MYNRQEKHEPKTFFFCEDCNEWHEAEWVTIDVSVDAALEDEPLGFIDPPSIDYDLTIEGIKNK